jgi:hypothetical protein
MLFGKKLKIFSVVFICFVGTKIILIPPLLYAQKVKELIPYLQQMGYTDEEISSIEKIVEEAVNNKLPEKYLYYRIKEGISKKVDYIMLYTTLIDKVSKLRIAKTLITKLFKEELQRDTDYSMISLSEMLEAGLPVHIIVKLGNAANNANVTTKEFVGYIELLKTARLDKIPEEAAISIVTEAISKKQPYKEVRNCIDKLKLQRMKEEITKEYIEKKLINR